jgi:uncharacterized protein YhbP (UPF0306 family)
LHEAKLIQVATAKNNIPWVATVWYVSDTRLNLYFISRKSRRHSLEIRENPNVAGTIAKPHFIGSGEKVTGLQFEGKCREAKGGLMAKARHLYLKKYTTAEKIPLKKLKDPDFTAAFYVIKPRSFVLFDEVNFPDDSRQEVRL